MTEIRRLGAADKADARMKNEPFRLWGRFVPALQNGRWSYAVEPLPEETEDCFPDEDYDPAEAGAIFLGAYEDGVCVGLAVLRRDMLRYLLLDDLKVRAAWRGRGIGGKLIEACMAEAGALGLAGVRVVAQDNNAAACRFYLARGFAVGGFDNRSYGGTVQAGKADLYFYRDL